MRAFLLVAFALALLGLAWFVSRGGSGGSPGVEPSRPEDEQPIRDPGIDGAGGEDGAAGERIAAGEEGPDEVEPVEEPVADQPSPLERARQRLDPEEVLLVVRVRTPEGEPLRYALLIDQIASLGRVTLELRLSYEPIEVGSAIPRNLEQSERSPFVEVRGHPTGAPPADALGLLSFRPEQASVFVALLANRRVLAVQHVRCDVGEVDFVVSLEEARSGHGSLRVRFVDGEGRPVDGVLLDPHHGRNLGRVSRPDVHGRVRILPRDAVSGHDGRVEIGPLEPGVYEYDAVHEAFATALLRARLEPGQALDLGTIVLEAPVTIAGRLVGPEGEIRGREVLIRRVTPLEESPDRETVSDSEGRFTLTDLEPGVYALRVASPVRILPGRRSRHDRGAYLSPFVKVDVTGGSVYDATVELEPAHQVNLRLHFTGEELVELRALDEGGFTLQHQVYEPYVIGTSWILPSGRYRLVATQADRSETVEFEAVSGIEVDVGR